MGLTVRPDIEQRLRMLATSKGVSIDAFLQQVIEEKSAVTLPRRLSCDEWAHEFEEWADSFPDAALIPDEALSRENLYPDRL